MCRIVRVFGVAGRQCGSWGEVGWRAVPGTDAAGIACKQGNSTAGNSTDAEEAAAGEGAGEAEAAAAEVAGRVRLASPKHTVTHLAQKAAKLPPLAEVVGKVVDEAVHKAAAARKGAPVARQSPLQRLQVLMYFEPTCHVCVCVCVVCVVVVCVYVWLYVCMAKQPSSQGCTAACRSGVPCLIATPRRRDCRSRSPRRRRSLCCRRRNKRPCRR